MCLETGNNKVAICLAESIDEAIKHWKKTKDLHRTSKFEKPLKTTFPVIPLNKLAQTGGGNQEKSNVNYYLRSFLIFFYEIGNRI